MQQLVIPAQWTGQRLDRALAELLSTSRSHVKMLLEHECIRIAGTVPKAGYILHDGDLVEVQPFDDPPAAAVAQDIPLDILYEDEFLVALNKPAGMVVHPAPGQWSGTVVNALLARWGWESTPGAFRPGIVHRLDKDTSGVLLIAKDTKTQEALARQFKERQIKKTYLAVVWKHLLPRTGTIALSVGRHPVDRKKMAVQVRNGRMAVSHYQVLHEIPHLSLIQLRLETGRTHQLRVHLAAIGHPIVGDPVYGARSHPQQVAEAVLSFSRQALHAVSLMFRHPVLQTQLSIRAPYPEDFAALVNLFRGSEKPTVETDSPDNIVIDSRKGI
ncbi:MAG: RluA family pseudouridine synthase [Deltaproteobacteria bacterium]|nr:RluA family pseudouridine synthase [Deltaproteobacteria bacterium]